MSRIVQVGGFVTARPGAYQNTVQRFDGASPGFLQSGIVAIIGEGTATIQPKVISRYRKGSDVRVKSELSGDLREAARIAFNPSNDDPNIVRGATEVLVIKPNPSTQSTLDLEDGSSNDYINLTSRIYGVEANGVSTLIAAGTSGAFGKKLTIGRFGYSDEVKDDIGFNAAMVIRYSGDASTATMALTSSSLTTTLAGDQADGSVNLSISFSTYDTLEKLANYINAQTSYEASVIRNDGSSFLCSTLDYYASGTDIKGPAASGSMTAGATDTTITGTLPTGTADGDILLVGSEYVYVTSASSKTVIRGYLNTTPAAMSTSTGIIYCGISSTNQDIIDYCNNRSIHVTAARDSAGTNGRPSSPSTRTYFTGGTLATASTTAGGDWDDAFNELRRHRVNFIVCLSDSATVHSKLAEHVNWRWGRGASEALAYTAATKDETLSQLKVRAKALNNANISMHFMDVEDWVDADGNTTTLGPWAHACAEAGMRAGMAFGEDPANKILPFATVDHGLSSDLLDLDPDLTEAGLSYSDYANRFNRFIRCVSTWTGNDDLEKLDHSVRNSLAWTLYKVRYRVQEKALGRSQALFGAQSLKSIIEDALEECRDVDKSIVEGSYLNDAGDRIPIPAFEVFPVSISGNSVQFSYRCVPTGSNLFFEGDTFVADFQDAA